MFLKWNNKGDNKVCGEQRRKLWLAGQERQSGILLSLVSNTELQGPSCFRSKES